METNICYILLIILSLYLGMLIIIVLILLYKGFKVILIEIPFQISQFSIITNCKYFIKNQILANQFITDFSKFFSMLFWR